MYTDLLSRMSRSQSILMTLLFSERYSRKMSKEGEVLLEGHHRHERSSGPCKQKLYMVGKGHSSEEATKRNLLR